MAAYNKADLERRDAHITEVRTKCVALAPDCKAASVKLCQTKGYKDGKSLDTDAAQSCSAKAMIPGRKPEEGDCRTENFVTQALCQ